MSTDRSDTSNAVSTDEDLYLLPDEPIQSKKSDDFAHTQYVKAITKTIDQVEPPWQIALFGRWGTGKSSVLNLVREKISNKGGGTEQAEFVEFDAWQHGDDSIRTEFLLRLDQELGDEGGVLGEERITEELYDVAYDDTSPARDDDLNGWTGWLCRQYQQISEMLRDNWRLLVIIAFISVIYVLDATSVVTIPDPITGVVFGAFSGAVFVQVVRQFSEYDASYRRLRNPRKDWSGAYSNLFTEILDKHGDDRYVIAIDNLDRCDPEVAYDILTSMKTFFEDDADGAGRCIYIVPCDRDALRNQIGTVAETASASGEPTRQETDFLKKFFQTTIHLPPFEIQEIETYVKTQLDRLSDDRLPNDQREDLVDVLTAYEDMTPRLVKQFVNRTLSLVDVAENIEGAQRLTYGAVTDNVSFLTAILVIQEEFPVVYSDVQDDPQFLTQLKEEAASDDIIGRRETGTDGDDRDRDQEETLENNPKLREFLKETSDHFVDPPDPYVYFSDAEYGSLYQEYREFHEAIQSGNIEGARDALEGETTDDDVDVERVVLDVVRRTRDGVIETTERELLQTLAELLAADVPFQKDIAAGSVTLLEEKQCRVSLREPDRDLEAAGRWRLIRERYSEEGDDDLVRGAVASAVGQLREPNSAHSKEFLSAALATAAEKGGDGGVSKPMRMGIEEEIEFGETSSLETLAGLMLRHPNSTTGIAVEGLLDSFLDELINPDTEIERSNIFEVLLEVAGRHRDGSLEVDREDLTDDLIYRTVQYDGTHLHPEIPTQQMLQRVNVEKLSSDAASRARSALSEALEADSGPQTEIAERLVELFDAFDDKTSTTERADSKGVGDTAEDPDRVQLLDEIATSLSEGLFDQTTDRDLLRHVVDEITTRESKILRRGDAFDSLLATDVYEYLDPEEFIELLDTLASEDTQALEEHLGPRVEKEATPDEVVFWAAVARERPEAVEAATAELIKACLDTIPLVDDKRRLPLFGYLAAGYNEIGSETLRKQVEDKLFDPLFSTDKMSQRKLGIVLQYRVSSLADGEPLGIDQKLLSPAEKTVQQVRNAGNEPLEELTDWLNKMQDSVGQDATEE